MCLKAHPPRPIPAATAALVACLFDDGEIYQFIGDILFDQFRDEDFADLYPKDGQPSISPVLLSFVTIFQSLEDLSDRKTVYGLRFRFDWKYALHLPPSYRGFDHTVLSEFRQRLLKHGAESRVFNAIFAQLKQLGFYKQKGIQRTDSLSIYTHHRRLKRIELCVETMRVCIKELLHRAPDWTRATVPTEWEERYAKRCKAERLSDEERTTLAVQVGDDGQWLLDRLEREDAADLRELRADFQIDFDLRQVTCPGGHTTPIILSGKNGEQAVFPQKTCAACPLRSRCCTGKKEGRALSFGPHYHATQAARQRQQTDSFKTAYRAHRSGVEDCLSALVRGQGIRTTRYDGQAKNYLRALFVGAAVNLARSAAWRSGYRPKKYPPRLGLVVGNGGAEAMAVGAMATTI